MIRIRYGTHGMGHAVRMGRLAKVLRQRGATVDIRAYGTDQEPLDRLLRDNPGCTLVLDRPINSDSFLAQVRPNVKKLMVVVGVGHTITRETQWIADAVLYQNSAGPMKQSRARTSGMVLAICSWTRSAQRLGRERRAASSPISGPDSPRVTERQ